MMKRFTLVLIIALLTASSTFAQVKPEKGSFGTEIQFNPFDQDGKTFRLDGLKLRYFLTNKDALRMEVGFGIYSDKYKADKREDDYIHTKTGDFNIDLGYERHFNLAKRLSVYVGGQLAFTKHFASAKADITINDKVYTNKWSNITGSGSDADRAYIGFGASAFTGLDFYVYKGLYVGTELGYGVTTIKNCKTKHEFMGEKETSVDSYRATSARFYIEPVVRLGWTF